MYYSRTFFELLFESVRKEILKITDNRLDILNKEGRPSSASLGNNLGEKEVASQIEQRKNDKNKDLLAYDENFKAVHYINLHPKVQELATQQKRSFFDFGRRLYLKMKQLEDQPDLEGIEIRDKFEVGALFQFIGTDEASFCTDHNVPPPSNNTTVRRKAETAKKSVTSPYAQLPKEPKSESFLFQIEEGYSHFLLCYYSKRSNQINKAIVSIANNDNEGPWEARQYGFHQAGGDTFASIPFRGEAKIYGRRLYINLESSQDSRHHAMQMNIVGLLEEAVAGRINQKPIPCTLLTVSIHGPYTIATEGYLLPCPLDEARAIMNNPHQLMESGIPLKTKDGGRPSLDELENLVLYLSMSRKHFHLEMNNEGEPITDLEKLAIRTIPVSKFRTRLKGTWRLWNFGIQRSALIESKLLIGDDFQAQFYPYIDPKVQRGLENGMLSQLATLAISDEIRKEQLCVTTYSPKGDLMNMTCFDFDGLQDDEIADGIFLSIGYDRPNATNHFKTNGPIGGYVVMRKVQPEEPDFEPQKIDPDKVEEYVKGLGLEDMLQRLRRLWKRKTQKKLVNLRIGAFAVCSDPQKGLLFIDNHEKPYEGRYHLPGGMLKKQGKNLEEILTATFKAQTGCELNKFELWQNATDILTIEHGQGIQEKIQLIGALYKTSLIDIAPGQKASYLNPRGMDKDKFTPFAWLAVQDYLKG